MRYGFIHFIAIVWLIGGISPAWGEARPDARGLDQASLRELARQFVQKIGTKLEQVEQRAQKSGDKGTQGEKNALTIIPDGQFLLLRPRLGQSVLAFDMGAFKNNGRIYYNLSDLIDVLELPIEYDQDKQIGSGWFMREDWLIRFNFKEGWLVSRGEEFNIKDEEVLVESGDIYISQQAVAEWMGLYLEPKVAEQYVTVTSAHPLPLMMRLAREDNVRGRQNRNEALLPRLAVEDGMAHLNTVDIRQTARVRKKPDTQTLTSHSNVTALEGSLLHHNAYAIGTWNNDHGINSVRARLSQRSEDAQLLGLLQARSYTLGDTDLPDIPLTGSNSQEFGVRVSNNPLDNSNFQSTDISGDSLPGWDVELYRNGVLLDFVTVGNETRYEFENVELFAGDNNFEIFFYGPQGEIRREDLNLPVTPALLETQNNTYDVALSLTDTQTYIKERSDDEDAHTPHFSARYNTFIGDTLAYAGLRARQVEGERKAFVGAGATKIIGGTLYDLNLGVDEELNSAANLSARRNIDDWYLSATAALQNEDYVPEGGLGSYVASFSGSAGKSFYNVLGGNANVNASGRYSLSADDSTHTSATLGLSQQMGRFNISNTTAYSHRDLSGADTDPTITNTLAARTVMGKVFTRAGLTYQVTPDSGVNSYFSQINYRHDNDLDTNLDLLYQPENNFKRARLNLNYRHEQVRLTPFIEVDSEDEVEVGLTVGTSLINNPNGLMPIATSDRVIGKGMVSSFVYHDKNGNEIFDGADEPLPDVILESVNVRRRAPTNEQGYALINNLPDTRVTDIRLDPGSFPDPFMIPAMEGVSILPEAGKTVELAFPVHIAGEVEGTIGKMDEVSGIVSGVDATIDVIPLDKRNKKSLSARAARDGFYFVEAVPPGRYLMAVDAASVKNEEAGGASPAIITIGYDGTVINGQDFVLFEGQKQVPVQMQTIDAALLPDAQPMIVMNVERQRKSKLAGLLSALVSRTPDEELLTGLASLHIDDSAQYFAVPGGDWIDQFQRCQILNNHYMPCTLTVLKPETDNDRVKTLLRTAQR